MGCCSSTASSAPEQKNRITHSRSEAGESRAPPPTEEETVKEVLSETPRLKPKVHKSVPIVSDPELEQENEEDDGDKSTSTIATTMTPSPKPVFPIFRLDGEKIEKKVSELKNVNEEISEICSLSESVSTTTNLTREDDDEVAHRVYRSPIRHPSVSGELGGGRRDQRLAGKSPSRRCDQSPGRRNGNGVGSVRIVQARDPGRAMTRRGLTAAEHHRRDSGEGSARRSRSPAMTRADGGGVRSGVGRSPSARRATRSPGRVNGATAENDRRAAENLKWPTKSTADESLENPLVSLECFIFL